MNKVLYTLKRKKKIILFGVIGIVIVSVLLMSLPQVKKNLAHAQENGIYAHTEEGIIKEEEYNGINFSNISMLTKDSQTTFTADITNKSDSDITYERLHIVLKDKDGNEVTTLLAYFPGGLKKNETKTITAIAKGNLTEAFSKEITE